MFRPGRRRRYLSNVRASTGTGLESRSVWSGGLVSARKTRTGYVRDEQGQIHAANIQSNLVSGNSLGLGGTGGFGTGSSLGFGGSSFGNSDAQIDRYNPIYDDLSRGTVAEDWIPTDPVLQNRMFWGMFHRGAVEGPVIETIAEMCWSDFDLAGIKDTSILDTFWAAKDSVAVHKYLEFITKEYLVIGRVVIQMILDANVGIWSDIIIHDNDYIQVQNIPRTGFMPMIDLIPSPETQAWTKSTDPRAVESRRGLPADLLRALGRNDPIPLEPDITAYIPRRSYFNDFKGTSFLVRNIPLWGLEKSLINATLTGHRRRAGPITQIAVGSEQWEPTSSQIDSLVAAYTAAEEDTVSSVIGTRYDVRFEQIRGSLQEMWKWEDSWAFLQEAKLRMFGVSEQLVGGDLNMDTTVAPTIFMERLKAHRRYIVETFLINKFFRALAHVHNFRRRTPAELQHRIIVDDDKHELILPTLVFHKNLDTTADMVRADLLEKMEEKGIPVPMEEWNRTLGGGELTERMRSAVNDLEFKLKAMKFQALQQKVNELQEGASSTENLEGEVSGLLKELDSLDFSEDEDTYHMNRLTRLEKQRAVRLKDGVIDGAVYQPTDTTIVGTVKTDMAIDRVSTNQDKNTYSEVGKAI